MPTLRAATIFLALVLALAGCAANTGQGNDPFAPEPEADSESQTGTIAELIPSVDELRIPAGLEGEPLASTILERITAWENAGASEALRELRSGANESWETFLPKVAESNRDTFAEALLGEGWQTDAELSRIADLFEYGNLAILQAYVATAWSGDEEPENIEGYRSWKTLNSAEQVGQTLTIDYSIRDNSDNNTIPPLSRTGGVYEINVRYEESATLLTSFDVLR